MAEPLMSIVPVVLSGGSGTRLWPASRLKLPKQLLPLVGDRSMIRATVDRMTGFDSADDPIIVTNADHADAITREMVAAGYSDARLILEPIGRNTAPAVAVAAHAVVADGDGLMLVLPADHTMGDEPAFTEGVTAAVSAASAGYLVTFGISPTRPETGYGYIKVGEPIDTNVLRVCEFEEKPDSETAASYLDSGEYLWNSGMFLIRASTYLAELECHAPDIAAASAAAFSSAKADGNRILLEAEAFGACRSESIDYAVMEPTTMAGVVPIDPEWNDVGSWDSLWDIARKDEHGNAAIGDILSIDTTNSYLRSSERLIATIGVDNLVVVDTPDAILVADRGSTQDVKGIVDKLKADGRQEFETDGSSERPWGRFRTIDQGPGYRVLHLSLVPGGKTSLKQHAHRSENWIVVCGIARITTGETTRLVPTKESVFIPPGELHRLENPGEEVLEVIEIDVGTYVGEDDIKRYLDAYGRTERRG